MAVPSIHVGCLNFAAGRLRAHLDSKKLDLRACVDLDLDASRAQLDEYGASLPVYRNLKEAKKAHPEIEACAIFSGSNVHTKLIIESLNLGLHTLCVKPVGLNTQEFQDIVSAHKKNSHLLCVQGQNLRWTKSSLLMQKWLREEIGELLGGNVYFQTRQPLFDTPDALVPGMYFHCVCGHQMDQVFSVLGQPESIYATTQPQVDIPEIGQRKSVWGTAGGNASFYFENGGSISYYGTRSAHGHDISWSGQFHLHGSKADIIREASSDPAQQRLMLYRNGECVTNKEIDDISNGIIEEDRRQMDAFGEAIENYDFSLQDSLTYGTWIAMEACNQSSLKGTPVNFQEIKSKLLVGNEE